MHLAESQTSAKIKDNDSPRLQNPSSGKYFRSLEATVVSLPLSLEEFAALPCGCRQEFSGCGAEGPSFQLHGPGSPYLQPRGQQGIVNAQVMKHVDVASMPFTFRFNYEKKTVTLTDQIMNILEGILRGRLFTEQCILYFPKTGNELNNHSLR